MTPDTAHTQFQHFDATTTPAQGPKNVAALRERLKARGLDGLIVPHEDEHQNEYLPEANERLAWVSGFTGSAGAAIILMDRAVLFSDGRYTLQSRAQTDPQTFDHEDFGAHSLADFIRGLKPDLKIGYDARLHAPSALEALKAVALAAGVTLVSVDPNPLDEAWGTDRPPQPCAVIVPQPSAFSGEVSADKRARLAKVLKSQGADAALITAPSSLAWLFNIRGGDVIRTPLPLGQAILFSNGRAELFVEPAKVTGELITWLGNEVAVKRPDDIPQSLKALSGQTVSVDPHVASAYWVEAVKAGGAKPLMAADPCTLPRACKSSVEIQGTETAHIRDGAVITRFLHWVATEAQTTLPTEIEVAQKLESLRAETGLLKDLSFDTISAFGPHGALPHYRVTRDSNLKLKPGHLLLVDSGAQYQDGTTDITRVMSIGTPRPDHRRMFTLVLKGHIALATARFPAGTTGTHLDALARQFLWAEGFDYDHGTGHGVGVYLGVHEGPQRIAKAMNTQPLMEGMIVSNEPGYYAEGDFGIRIENLQVVTKAEIPTGGERPMHGFANLTWAPIDRHLIEVGMLTEAERTYMDAYHARTFALLAPMLSADVRDWLQGMCAPL